MKKRISWKGFHRWVGLVFAVVTLIFCVSGIILNHRELVADCNVSRSLLPSSYHIRQYNNGSVKGTFPLGGDSLLTFGSTGVWLTDRKFSSFQSFNDGLPSGLDGRNIKNMVRTKDGTIWCAAQFGLYKLIQNHWEEISLPGNSGRLSDIAPNADSTLCVVATRSALYIIPSTGGGDIRRVELKDAGNAGKPKVTLFKTIWMLHSGELFGLSGKIMVDIVALFIAFLCVTGIVIFILPYNIRRLGQKGLKEKIAGRARSLKWNFKWHNKIGYATIILTILLAVTGMCLRPPLMIPFVLVKTAPLPGSALDRSNAWHDKLRGIRWDKVNGNWLLSTSEGFATIDATFSGKPMMLKDVPTPPVSPMGVNVFEQVDDGLWLIGSFSGIFSWDMKSGEIVDISTGKPYDLTKRVYGTGGSLVSGFSQDLIHTGIANSNNGKSGFVVFDYAKGAPELPEASEEFLSQPMSLWNMALELHVGRSYTPFLGPLSELFVFLSGLLLTLVLVSGLILSRRRQ